MEILSLTMCWFAASYKFNCTHTLSIILFIFPPMRSHSLGIYVEEERKKKIKTLLVNINLLLHKIPMICLKYPTSTWSSIIEMSTKIKESEAKEEGKEEIRLLSDYISWEKKKKHHMYINSFRSRRYQVY